MPAEIRACVDAYLDGMARCSRPLLERAFHEDSRVVGPDDGHLRVMDREAFVRLVLRQSPVVAIEAEVLEVLVDGAIASVRLRDTFLNRVFIDHLALVELDGVWRIYTKLWHVERRL